MKKEPVYGAMNQLLSKALPMNNHTLIEVPFLPYLLGLLIMTL